MLILNAAHATPQWRAFMAYEIERNRALYSFADTGIAMLPPRSARCVGTARVLYAQILDRIERRGYDVFSGRARVPTWRKAATAARIMVTGPRSAQEASGGLPAKEHDRCHSGHVLVPLPEVSRPERPFAHPDRTRAAAAGGPDGFDLAAGQAGADRRRAADLPAQNSGGWFVAGASGDVGRKESVTRTIAGREVVFWRNSAGELVAGPGRLPASRGAVGQVPGDGRHHVLPLARPRADPER